MKLNSIIVKTWRQVAILNCLALSDQITAVLNFGIFNGPKKNSNSTHFIQGLRKRNLFFNPLVRRQSSHLSPSSSTCRSSGNHLQRLFKKTIEGLDCKINGLALWAALQQAWAGRTGEHTHTRRFRVGGSCCWPRHACFEGNVLLHCYHSCNTDSVRESKIF